MEALLQIVPSRIHARKLTEITFCNSSSGVGQVGFASLIRRNRETRHQYSIRVKTRRSCTGDGNGGGFISGSSRNSAEDKKEEEDLLLRFEKDSGGSVVGFNLIPHSGKKYQC
ncbi:Pentafunctional AROM polypeptide [Orobanche minor]